MNRWKNHRILVTPFKDKEWCSTSLNAINFKQLYCSDHEIIEGFVSGRDTMGRSLIGRINFNTSTGQIESVSSDPIIDLGQRGAFDENGLSYPNYCVFKDEEYIFYTGWIEGVQQKWYNGVGLLKLNELNTWERTSKAPIFHRSDADFIGFGSNFVMRDMEKYIMLITRFEKWSSDGSPSYNLKISTNVDIFNFEFCEDVVLPFENGEYIHSKPFLLKLKNKYLIFFSKRGSTYSISCAQSEDLINWQRVNSVLDLNMEDVGIFSEMVCYPCLIITPTKVFIFYTGDGYGKSGIGIGEMRRSEFDDIVLGL